MARRAPFAIMLCLLTVLALPGAAFAQARSGAAGDAQGATPTLDGSPRTIDIEQVRVYYDPAGTLSATVRFYEANAKFALGSWVQVNTAQESVAGWLCDHSSTNKGANLQAELYGNAARLSVSGFAGNVAASRSLSSDGRELTISATHAALAGLDLRCFDALVFTPDPDGHCSPSLNNCRIIAYSYVHDELAPHGWFAGFAPPPPPECDDTVDNDGDGDTDWGSDDGCTNATDTSEASPPPPPPPPRASLTKTQAVRYVRQALKTDYRRRFTNRRGALDAYCYRKSRVRFACDVDWDWKRFWYNGEVRVKAFISAGTQNWSYTVDVNRFALRKKRR